MIDRLFQSLQKPSLWQRSSEPFWDDDHISKGMLEAHLNPDWDAASRKHSFIDLSVKWLSGIIPANGKILDLGCGSGLYAKRLSDMGYDVTGMDYSRRSIAYAKGQDAKTEYVFKNYLELDYTDTFDAVLLIYCDFAALTPNERRMLIPKVHQALKPGGLFIFDVFTERALKDKKDSITSWSPYENGGFWCADSHICLEASYLYENNTVAVNQCVVVKDDGIKEYLIWDTAYSVQKLTDEVSPFGFKVKGIFNDVSGAPYTGEAETLCFVLEREKCPAENNIRILSLRDHPERVDECRELLLKYFNEPSSEHPARVLASAEIFPQGYFMLKDNRVIGWTGLYEKEVVTGKVYGWEGSLVKEEILSEDLSPWITPLLVHPDERGNHYGKLLLEHARKEAGRLGFKIVYLTTGHIGYYEKYGFREVGLTTFTWGRPTKVYEHDTVSG